MARDQLSAFVNLAYSTKTVPRMKLAAGSVAFVHLPDDASKDLHLFPNGLLKHAILEMKNRERYRKDGEKFASYSMGNEKFFRVGGLGGGPMVGQWEPSN